TLEIRPVLVCKIRANDPSIAFSNRKTYSHRFWQVNAPMRRFQGEGVDDLVQEVGSGEGHRPVGIEVGGKRIYRSGRKLIISAKNRVKPVGSAGGKTEIADISAL